jgi:metal-dependent amidase/aminoacylase/carboxypeptidase family protein
MTLKEQIKAETALILDEIIAIRRHLHQHPELSFVEFKTSCTEIIKICPKKSGYYFITQTNLLDICPAVKANHTKGS